eukprot:augustus_masked-scaffold_2-processed-gene-14.44-mRNA-1 protein AED:0.01 eAED:0.02 QI:0/-1/0/1/-1/1/1/0/426
MLFLYSSFFRGIGPTVPNEFYHIKKSSDKFSVQENNLRKPAKSLITKNYPLCVIGAGLSGAVIAHEASKRGDQVLIVESRPHVGGNCYDYRDPQTGILMNKYGAHLFHTKSSKVWNWIQKFNKTSPFVRYDHKVLVKVDGRLIPIPININSVNILLEKNILNETEMKIFLSGIQEKCDGECKNAEEMARSRVGYELYKKIFRDYTKKQWDRDPKDLAALVTARIPVRSNFDDRYFSDRYQALPKYGYTKFFESILDQPGIEVLLGINFFDVRNVMYNRCGKIVFTGPIDKYFENKLGNLEYRSIIFEEERFFNINGYKQENSVINYPGKEAEFTRIVEYKHFLNQDSPHTITVKEFSTAEGDPYYPVPNEKNQNLFNKYRELAIEEEKKRNVFFVGRLANYKYFNMDQAILNALNVFEDIYKTSDV